MKKKLFNHGIAVMGIAVLVFLAMGSATNPSVRQAIQIGNNTGAVISQVYVRNTGQDTWGGYRNAKARTRQELAGYYNNGQPYYSTVYVRDANDNIVYDRVDVPNGSSYSHTVTAIGETKEDTPTLPNIDIKVVDSNGVVYGKYNIDLATTERVTFTSADRHPTLTMQNNTGFPVNITSPGTRTINNGASVGYQLPELTSDRKVTVSYSINNYTFSQEVNLDTNVTIPLTERPPTITVRNNTGYPITITSPFNQTVSNGNASNGYPKQSRTANARHTITYTSGSWSYTKEVMLENEDVTITLTEADRPPVVTILNNTGSTVNLVFLRNPNTNWPNTNILALRLKEDGTVDTVAAGTGADVRAGSFTNRETTRFWLGNIQGVTRADRYDIRIDDVNNASYVKSNIQITGDVTLTFTASDRR